MEKDLEINDNPFQTPADMPNPQGNNALLGASTLEYTLPPRFSVVVFPIYLDLDLGPDGERECTKQMRKRERGEQKKSDSSHGYLIMMSYG